MGGLARWCLCGPKTPSAHTQIEALVPRQKLVHIHASAEEPGLVHQPALAICATTSSTARSLETQSASL